jgi:dTDP-4-amino-4,6-dideoxygalactose transaminase
VSDYRIPFFPPDLFAGDRELLLRLLRQIGTSPAQRFILGEHTARLEELLRAELGCAEVIACGSGTSALTLILHAMGVRTGDEVVVPAFGCAPLAETVVNLGATPVFADIRPRTMVVDPDEVDRLVTHRTKAIVPAHMFSVMADMPRLREIARAHDVWLVEDSAVAQGAVLRGKPAGTWGDAGLFSFVQVKTFGMPGEGGVVVTDDPVLGRTVRMLRNHGQDGAHRFLHHRVGHNSRFDEIQAAFQLHRFPGLAGRLERRAEIADYYTERFTPLAEQGVVPPPPGREGRCYYVYCLLAERRDELAAHLAGQGIQSHVYYPRSLPNQAPFAPFTPPGARWPNAERACARILALPVYPHLTDEQVTEIADAVCEFAPRRSPKGENTDERPADQAADIGHRRGGPRRVAASGA